MLRFVTYLDTISLLVVAIIGLILYRKLFIEFKVFVIFLIYGSLTGIAAAILSNFKVHNLFMFNILALVEYLVSIYILIKWAQTNLISFLLILSAFIYSFLWYWTTFDIMGFQQYNFYIRMLHAVLMVLFSGILLVNVSDFTKKNMLYDPRFWMGLSWLLFFSISIIIYVFSELFMNQMSNATAFGIITKSIANILEYTLIAIALICNSTNRKSY